ncbi:Ig-like domain-containing protein [Marinobacter hydrocarbonoclasticus]|nr:Ig-like domain-containing protein [Marinobacter nauticus]
MIALTAHLRLLGGLGLMLMIFGCGGPHSGFPSAECGQPEMPCPDQVVRLEISPSSSSLDVGTQRAYIATAIYGNDEKADVTAETMWQVANPQLANITPDGTLTAITTGETQVQGSFAGVSATATLSISRKTLTALRLTPPEQLTLVGLSTAFEATALYQDGSEQSVTSVVTWSTEDPEVAQIDDGGRVTATAVGRTTVIARWRDMEQQSPMVVLDSPPLSLTIAPTAASLPLGAEQQLHSALILADKQSIDVTGLVNWQVDEHLQPVDPIQQPGQIRGILVGRGNAQATLTLPGATLVAQVPVTVTPAELVRLQVTPANGVFPIGTEGRYRALAFYSDGQTLDVTRQALWGSRYSDVITLDNGGNDAGRAMALSPGQSQVSASYRGVTGETGVTITPAVVQRLQIQPSLTSLPAGLRKPFQAIGVLNNGHRMDLTDQVRWQSEAPSVAAFIGTGALANQALTRTSGETTITARFGAIQSTALLTVTDAQLTALTLRPETLTLPAGTQGKLQAVAHYTDGHQSDVTQRASWRSAAPETVNVAAIGPDVGTVIARSPGSAEVRAGFGGLSAGAAVTVTDATPTRLTVAPAQTSLAVGRTMPLTAWLSYSDGSRRDVTRFSQWQTDQPGVATVASQGGAAGRVSAHRTGQAAIQSHYQGLTAKAVLTVTKAEPEHLMLVPYRTALLPGTQQQYVALAHYTDGSQHDVSGDAVWHSLAPATASVDASGLATGHHTGTTDITASLPGTLLSASGKVSVLSAAVTIESLHLAPYRDTVLPGGRITYSARAQMSDGSQLDVSSWVVWRSLTPQLADIDASGTATGLNEGKATIEASIGHQGQLYQASASLFVVPPSVGVRDFAIRPYRADVLIGGQQPYQATLTLEDGTRLDVTDQTSWDSDTAETATVSATGLATGHQAGHTNITARLVINERHHQAEARLWVSEPPGNITSLSLLPGQSDLLLGSQLSLKAVAHTEDGTQWPVSGEVSWQSVDPNIASVNAEGQVIGNSTGETRITARRIYQGKLYQGDAWVRVIPPAVTPVALAISPLQHTIRINDTTHYQVTALMSDNSRVDVSDQVQWLSDSPTVAIPVNQQGQWVGLAEGLATVTARYRYANQSLLATSHLKVLGSSVSVVSVAIEPATVKMPVGSGRQLTATALFDDGSVVDVTDSATWHPGDPEIAQVDSHGWVTGNQTGHTPINGAVNVGSWVNKSVSATITNPNNTVSTVRYAPDGATLIEGGLLQLTATAIWVDGSEVDVTEDASWEALNPEVAVLTDVPGQIRALAEGEAAFRGGYQVGNTTHAGFVDVSVKHDAVTIQRIRIEPATLALPLNGSASLSALAELSDGSEVTVTRQVVWGSSDHGVVAINPDSGEIHGLKAGQSTVTARFNLAGVSHQGEAIVTVSEP